MGIRQNGILVPIYELSVRAPRRDKLLLVIRVMCRGINAWQDVGLRLTDHVLVNLTPVNTCQRPDFYKLHALAM